MTADGPAGGDLTVHLNARAPTRGLIVDAHGHGIANARVALLPRAGGAGGYYARRFVTADDAGHFVFSSPPAPGARLSR